MKKGIKRVMVYCSMVATASSLAVPGGCSAQTSNARTLTRPVALRILQSKGDAITKPLYKEVLVAELPFVILRCVANADEIAGRITLDLPSIESLKQNKVPWGDFLIGHILNQFSKESFLLKQNKLTNLSVGLELDYAVASHQDVRLSDRYDKKGLQITTYKAKLNAITGISQQGNLAQVDAEIAYVPTEVSQRAARIISNVLSGLGIDPQQFKATDPFKSSSVYIPRVYIRDTLLAVDQQPKNEVKHYLFQLYDDGWRLIQAL